MKNKLRIELLLLLIVAMLLAPGASATPSKTTACTGCHDLGLSLGITNIALASTTVTPGQVFNVDVSWTGGDSSGTTTVKWLTISANNNQFSFNPVQRDGASAGTASFAVTAPATSGTYTIGVYAATGPSAMDADYKEVVITVSPPVVDPVLTTISVTPVTADLVVGGTQAFTAAPKDQNGNPMVVEITWTSSNTTVGNVDASGKFTASAAGTTTIKAANGTVNGTATVTVTTPIVDPVLTTISVTPATANLVVGANQSFTAAPKDQNGNPMVVAITWTSSNTTVGNVDVSGKFTATAAGTTTVKAANGSVNGTATVTVTTTVIVPVITTIIVTPATANLVVGTTQAFTAAPKDQNGNPMVVAITWTSSNTTVGNVDASGKFTASAVGTATIKAENGTVNGTATVTVTTSPPHAEYYIVTFIVTDNVTGKPIHDAKVSIDGSKKETNHSGIVVFKKVSAGNHIYKIKSEHYEKFQGSIEVGANMTISVKLVPKKEKDDEKHEEKDDEKHEEKDHDEHPDKVKESDNKDKNKITENKKSDKEKEEKED